LRTKEQGMHLTLNEHDDDDDDNFKIFIYRITRNFHIKITVKAI